MPPLTSPPLTITVLGSGTSTGVPVIGCPCAICRSSDPRNKRLRPSILITVHGDVTRRILVDTTPDMRTQVLRAGIDEIDAVVVTHPHADHIFGMDDLRQFNFRMGREIPVYATEATLHHIRTVFAYVFQVTQEGGGKPQLALQPIQPYEPFELCGVTITPLTVMHGNYPVTAFKFGDQFAYVTDVSAIPEETVPHLRGLDTLILGTVRYEPHPTHFGLGQALDAVTDFYPKQTFFTHLGHHYDYATLLGETPANVAPCYDGLTFSVPAGVPPA